jgi:cytochrome P450
MFHYPEFWTQPEEFIPERWLGDSRFANDQKRIFTPFSVGPRVCIGKKYVFLIIIIPSVSLSHC